MPHLDHVFMLQFLKDLNLTENSGWYAPVAWMVQFNLLQGDHLATVGTGECCSQAFGSVHLTVCPLANLLKATVVSDGTSRERVTMEGIVVDS